MGTVWKERVWLKTEGGNLARDRHLSITIYSASAVLVTKIPGLIQHFLSGNNIFIVP